MAQQGLNDVAIAEAIGVSDETIRRDLASMSTNVEMPETVIRSDGTTYTRPTKPRTVTVDLDTGEIDDMADGGRAEQAGRDAADPTRTCPSGFLVLRRPAARSSAPPPFG